jgi:dienelactone hydrolase
MKYATHHTLVLISVFAIGCGAHGGGTTAGDDDDDSAGGIDAATGGGTDGTPPSHDVVVTNIPELPGSKLMVRPDAIPAPGIVLLHGSEGGAAGYIDEDGRRLAEEGFAVLVFCWFGCPGRPPSIVRIRLEDTVAGINWLRASDAVRGAPVGLFGWSRGAEQSVLLASLVRDTSVIAAVGVHAASDTVVAAYDPQTEESPWEMDPQTGEWVFAPAWTWQGQPLYGESGSFSEPGPRIRVEDYPGAMFLSHGTADDLWPVTRTQNIERTRNNAGLPTEAHYWQGQGHIIEDPAMLEQFFVALTAFYDRELR